METLHSATSPSLALALALDRRFLPSVARVFRFLQLAIDLFMPYFYLLSRWAIRLLIRCIKAGGAGPLTAHWLAIKNTFGSFMRISHLGVVFIFYFIEFFANFYMTKKKKHYFSVFSLQYISFFVLFLLCCWTIFLLLLLCFSNTIFVFCILYIVICVSHMCYILYALLPLDFYSIFSQSGQKKCTYFVCFYFVIFSFVFC